MLTVCPTPIGNLGDVTSRQVAALRAAHTIACEDTRVTGKLLQLIGIQRENGRPRLVSNHDHNESARVEELIALMENGESVVLVSDAGTPGVADPGFRLISAAQDRGIRVDVLPGACAAIVGLVASGFPSDRFEFRGFLSPKSQARRAELESWQGGTLVLYESPQRLKSLLEDVSEVCGDCMVFVGRELTKLHEEHLRGNPAEVLAKVAAKTIKGECVVVLHAPYKEQDDALGRKLVAELVSAGLAPQAIKTIVSQTLGVQKSLVYSWIEDQK